MYQILPSYLDLTSATKICHGFCFSKTVSETKRLHPYHCDLNVVAFIWNVIKTKVAHKIVGQSTTDIQNPSSQVIENMNMEDQKNYF
jgi:hypothetical protein